MELRDYMKDKAKAMGLKGVRINAAGCLDRCELGPNLVIYPEGVWYHFDTKADIDEILTEQFDEASCKMAGAAEDIRRAVFSSEMLQIGGSLPQSLPRG